MQFGDGPLQQREEEVRPGVVPHRRVCPQQRVHGFRVPSGVCNQFFGIRGRHKVFNLDQRRIIGRGDHCGLKVHLPYDPVRTQRRRQQVLLG